MCEYDTLDSDVYSRTDLWIVRNYYFWTLPLMSLTDVLIILLMLDARCKDDLDFILIEDITLFSCDLNCGWISLIFEDIPFFICDLGICCFS